MIFILIWCIFFFTWIVGSCMVVLNYVKKLILMNTYMLIELWMLLVIAYMSSVGDFDGECIYVKWMVMIIWCMNGDKHVYVMLFVEHVKCWLLVVNSYMLILMVILLVNACMQNDGDDVVNCCVNICIVSSHMFMHTWLMMTDFISKM
jgi:hypothetical protein